ncbi:hypothetical protein ACIOJD_18795 [Streptomyces sp. NPDC088116]|uniref:hypothetical protein n=1 Tax=Streptomyces sp. NPDC088116 TaxID=3365825 RepID=UPI0038001B9B
MGESVSVHCPSCGSRHAFMASVYPCVCGAPVAPPLLTDVPVEPVTHRTWDDDWVRIRCTECGRQDQWPQPELGCACGSLLRIPVRPVSPTAESSDTETPVGPDTEADLELDVGVDADTDAGAATGAATGADRTSAPDTGPPTAGPPTHIPLPRTAASPRPSFRPPTIRTPHDAVTAAALYLGWLGFKSVVRAEDQPASGIDLRGPGVVAQVDPTAAPASVRSVECLWLNGLSASVVSVYFSLAGYADEARARADDLGLPLFVMDLTGAPQPVNGPADELVSAGA